MKIKFVRSKLLRKLVVKIKRSKFLKKLMILNLVIFVSGIYNVALISPVQADSFYPNANASDCNFAQATSVSYRGLPNNSTSAGCMSYETGHVYGESGSYPESRRITNVADLTYPDAHRYRGVADRVGVPPNTRIDVGYYIHNYSGHNVTADHAYLFVSRNDPANGDWARLGASGNLGTYPANPLSNLPTGRTIYSFTTIQPIQIQSRTATPEFVGGGNLRIRYDLTIRNVSAYNLPNIRVIDDLPSGERFDQTQTFSSGQTRTFTYYANMGSSYSTNITNSPAQVSDPNRHKEEAAIASNDVYNYDPETRTIVTNRTDSGAPAGWTGRQPDFTSYPAGDYYFIELIPYSVHSDNTTVNVPPNLSVTKVVSDDDETDVKSNEARPGDEITYDIEVRNTGGNATGVTVIDDYDESLINILNADGGIDNEDTISWNIGNLNNQESRSFTITAQVIAPLEHGQYQAPNTVVVDSDQTPPIDDYSTQTNITAEVIMEIDKQVSDSDEEFGDSNHLQGAHPDNAERLSTYSIYIQNSGDADAHHVTIHDDVSEVIRNASILNISNDGVLTTTIVNGQLTGEIIWNIGDLPQGENRTVTFDALFNAGIDDLLEINNIAEVRTDEVPPLTDSTITTIHSPILEIEKDDGIEFAEPNQSVHWVINARNTGTGNAYNVEVYDYVPERMEISNISDRGVWDTNERRILWSTTEPHYILNGSYNPDPRSTWGSSKELSFDAQLDQMFLDGDVVLTNLAILETDFYPPIETEHDLPVLTPLLEIIKYQELTEVIAPGQPITYTIEYRNIGTGHAPDAFIIDTLPEHTQFVEFIETDSNIEGFFNAETDEIRWELGTLDPDSEGSVAFKVVIEIPTQSDTEIRNIAIIDSPITEPEESEVITSTVDSCCLGGFIWEDANNDGIYDVNEYGIQGVSINIKWGETEYLDGEDIEIFTDENGHYEYTGLPYHTLLTVSVDIPDGFDEITTDSEYKLVLLPPNDDGTIEDYELDGVHYLTAGQCINFLNAGIYRDIILAQTGQSIFFPLLLSFSLIGASGAILFLRKKKK